MDVVKTLISEDKYVSHTWQALDWKVTITAKNWDVELETITDKYPSDLLSYSGYKTIWNWEDEWIKIINSEDDKKGRVVWNVSWTLQSWHKIELIVYTTVKVMPEKEVVNVACAKPVDTWQEECGTWHIHDLRIKKHILDKNNKLVKQITWNVGDAITYVIEFGNDWDEPATVILKDYLPKWVEFISGTLVVGWAKSLWTTWVENLGMMYEWKTVEIQWVNINLYESVRLAANQSWTLIIEWKILESKEENYNRTNFACIFDNDGNRIDCDDAHHNIEPNEFKCEKLNVSPAWDLPNVWWSKEVKCSTSGGVADLITIDCGTWASWNRYITWVNKSELTGKCEYPSWEKTYNLKCTVEKDNKEYTSNSCNWSVTVKWSSWPSWCFPAWTTVMMADGSNKNIEDVKVWDSVLSYNTDTNTNERSVVQETFIHENHIHEMYELTINWNVLKVTDVHPFYVRKSASSKDYAWVEAQDLKVGDILLMNDGNLVKIDKINHYDNQETVYNLEVADNHDYFVDEWYLVHNKCTWECCGGSCWWWKGDPTPYCKDHEDDPICELANPHCFNVNEWNFSIEVGEYLPFYFNVYRNREEDIKHTYKYVTNEDEECNLGDVDLSSLKCRYVIRKPAKTSDRINWDDVVYRSDPFQCLTLDSRVVNESMIGKWVEKQKELYDIDVDDYETNYWPEIQTTKPSVWNVKDNNGDNVLWEYQFQIEVFKYRQCGKENTAWKDQERTEIPDANIWVCQSNFVLTEPYTVQKTPSGNLTASTKTLDKFKMVNWNTLETFSKYLNAIATSDYHPNDTVNKAMDGFINKYQKLAVKVDISKSKFLSSDVEVKKVPGKHIYFVDGDITVKWWNRNIETPFTIVQTSGKTTINGNVGHNMMLLTKWNIIFSWDCETNQNVKWIFYAQGNLIREWVKKNDNLNNNVRCTKWWLNVKWVLIWKNFNNLMINSRSHLETWFNRDGSRADETQLASKVMNWWSVVIEYSPSIFTKGTMPPGAEEFTTALSIYKN